MPSGKSKPTQPDLLPSPTTLRSEKVVGPQLLTRLKELQAQGMIVLRMKCGPGNADYEIEFRSDWDSKKAQINSAATCGTIAFPNPETATSGKEIP